MPAHHNSQSTAVNANTETTSHPASVLIPRAEKTSCCPSCSTSMRSPFSGAARPTIVIKSFIFFPAPWNPTPESNFRTNHAVKAAATRQNHGDLILIMNPRAALAAPMRVLARAIKLPDHTPVERRAGSRGGPKASKPSAMPLITSGRVRVCKKWIDDALGGAARCRLGALRQRGIAAFDAATAEAVGLQANRIVRIVGLGPSRGRRQNRRDRQNRQSRIAHRRFPRECHFPHQAIDLQGFVGDVPSFDACRSRPTESSLSHQVRQDRACRDRR
jgi:hypothetical protein